MKSISFKTILVVTLAFSIAACGNRTERRITTGAAIGGAAGYVLSGGDTITTLGSAALGGLAGGVYDHQKSKKENYSYHSNSRKPKHSRGRGHGVN